MAVVYGPRLHYSCWRRWSPANTLLDSYRQLARLMASMRNAKMATLEYCEVFGSRRFDMGNAGYIILGVSWAIAALLLVPYLIMVCRLVQARHLRILRLGGENSDEVSKSHLLYVLSKAKEQCDICSGSLHATVWDQQVADAIDKALHRRPNLRIRMLTGPVLDGYQDLTHPVLAKYLSAQGDEKLRGRWEIRRLNRYPRKGQGKHADGNLYVELEDDRGAYHRSFVTFYKDYLPNRTRVDAWLASFDSLYDNPEVQLPGLPLVEGTVDQLTGQRLETTG